VGRLTRSSAIQKLVPGGQKLIMTNVSLTCAKCKHRWSGEGLVAASPDEIHPNSFPKRVDSVRSGRAGLPYSFIRL